MTLAHRSCVAGPLLANIILEALDRFDSIRTDPRAGTALASDAMVTESRFFNRVCRDG